MGEPHTKTFGGSLFELRLNELRLKGAEGIAHVFYCTLVGHRVVMLTHDELSEKMLKNPVVRREHCRSHRVATVKAVISR